MEYFVPAKCIEEAVNRKKSVCFLDAYGKEAHKIMRNVYDAAEEDLRKTAITRILRGDAEEDEINMWDDVYEALLAFFNGLGYDCTYKKEENMVFNFEIAW